MARRDGMPRLELISLHLASGAGCSARPRLMVTPEDFLSPPVCIGSTGNTLRPRRVPSTNRDTRRAANNVGNTLFNWRATADEDGQYCLAVAL